MKVQCYGDSIHCLTFNEGPPYSLPIHTKTVANHNLNWDKVYSSQ